MGPYRSNAEHRNRFLLDPLDLLDVYNRTLRLGWTATQLTGGARKPTPRFVHGFTDNVTRYMRLSVYFIGKPGPGCISEALAMRLRVIVERTVHTMIQERFNVDWIQENRVGIVFSSFSRIAGAVRAMLLPARHREDN